jgi:hypothetical protein
VGELRPKSKFLGNSVSTTMEGENRVTLLGAPNDGEYIITMPNMYARGILFGKMVLELGDTCTAKNEHNNLSCDLEFKTKVRSLIVVSIFHGILFLFSKFYFLGILLWDIQLHSW